MNRNKTYGPILNEKFNGLPFPDMNTTWPGMKDILDKEMPQEKKRRLLFWFSNRIGMLFLILSIAAIPSLLYIYSNYTQNNLQKKSIAIQNENKSNQFVYPTTKKSLAEIKVRKNEDDIMPEQNTGEPVSDNNSPFQAAGHLFPSGRTFIPSD